MKTFAELEQQNMIWVRGRKGNTYELRAVNPDTPNDPGELLATLTRSNWRMSASVEATGNRWTFDRKGFWRPRYIIRSVGTGEEPAQLTRLGGKATLTYHDGREFHWRQVNVWSGNRWVWSNAEGEPLMGIQVRGVFRQRGEISLDPELSAKKAPSLLLFLGWYLILLQQSETAAIVTVASG
jgi:hypothetical protein